MIKGLFCPENTVLLQELLFNIRFYSRIVTDSVFGEISGMETSDDQLCLFADD